MAHDREENSPAARGVLLARCCGVALTALLPACDDGGPAPADGDGDADSDADGDADGDGDGDADADLPDTPEVPLPPDHTPTFDSMAAGFRLYYRERVERAVIAYNRHAIFGDTTFATAIGRHWLARSGRDLEIIPGPVDNNNIGEGAWMAYNAYRIFRTRQLELTLIRLFDGLVFFEAVSGHPGLTAREVLPGWTMVIDGVADTVTRTRFGVPVTHPMPGSPALEAEVLDAFFDGLRVTYRENPPEYYFDFFSAAEPEQYAITYSFSELPRYLRVSDCCSSFMRTPEPHPWAGAFWGNHNSRDNFPDLTMGFIAARAAANDAEASADVRAAAQRAVEAGQRIGDLVAENDNALMTVDEHNPYATLVISGAVRPDTTVEGQDLGQLTVCSVAYLGRAISSDGLAAPVPELPLPGSLDYTYFSYLDWLLDCEIPEEGIRCTSVAQAWCGRDWSNFHHIAIAGQPLLEYIRDYPDLAPTLLSGFQDDFDEMAMGAVALVDYARIVGDAALYDEARRSLFYVTWLMGELGELAYAAEPERLAEQLYRAALYAAQGDLPIDDRDLAGFARAEAQIAALESLLTFGDTGPSGLLSDAELRDRIESRLEGRSEPVIARYRAEYGETPPIRRAGDGYEARGTPLDAHPWTRTEQVRHHSVGGGRLLRAIPLCEQAPQVLDCTWARLGCARVDLDGSGVVDDRDRTLFAAAREAHGSTGCTDTNDWCGGADLDRDGTVSSNDDAFIVVAQGCWY